MDIEPRSPLGYLGQPLTATQQHFLALQIVLVILATIAVGLRLYARNLIKAKLWWDDYTIIFAWVNKHACDLDRRVWRAYTLRGALPGGIWSSSSIHPRGSCYYRCIRESRGILAGQWEAVNSDPL